MARLYTTMGTCNICPASGNTELCNSGYECPEKQNYELGKGTSGEPYVVWTEDLDMIFLRREEVKELAEALGMKVVDND